MPLTELREKIDRIDSKILHLIEERMEIAKKVGFTKRKNGMEIKDEKREEEIIRRLTSKSSLNKKFVRKIFENIIAYCRDNE